MLFQQFLIYLKDKKEAKMTIIEKKIPKRRIHMKRDPFLLSEEEKQGKKFLKGYKKRKQKLEELDPNN